MSKQLVRKSNKLTSAAHRLTAAEQRVVLCAISQITPMRELTDDLLYTVTTQDLVAAGLSTKNAAEILSSACAQLYNRSVTVAAEDGEPIVTRWLQSLRDPTKTDGSSAQLRFSKDLIPYLSNLSGQFTEYSLRQAVSLSSAHAVRIFELIAQYKSIGSRVMAIDELRAVLMLEDKYSLFSDFRKRVLDTSVEQINKHTPTKVKYELMRTGRKITHVKFVFTWADKKEEPQGTVSASADEFKSMTDKQRSFFGNLLSELPALQGMASVGMTPKAFVGWLTDELAKPERLVEWADHLKAVGYIPTVKKHPPKKKTKPKEGKAEPEAAEPGHDKAPTPVQELVAGLTENIKVTASGGEKPRKGESEMENLKKIVGIIS